MNRIMKISWATGFIVAGMLDLFWYLSNAGIVRQPDPESVRFLEKITLIVWPSSIMLMATEGATTVVSVIAVSISLILNGLFYVVIGYLAVKLVRAFN
jgi:hypothetical protein